MLRMGGDQNVIAGLQENRRAAVKAQPERAFELDQPFVSRLSVPESVGTGMATGQPYQRCQGQPLIRNRAT